MLAPLDIFVFLKVSAKGEQPWVQFELANELFISQASVHRALKIGEEVRLYSVDRRRMNAPRLEELLVHASRYFFPPTRGGEVRGIPTAWAAPPLSDALTATGEPAPVWPDPFGTIRGIAFEPLHKTAPKAAKLDNKLYELLSIVDALREGGARESQLAGQALHERLYQP